MSELLVTMILAVCPMPSQVETTECHEFFVNCAVGKHGKVDEKGLNECLKKWEQRESVNSSSISN